METGTQEETMQEHCVLACPHDVLNLPSYTSQDHFPRDSTATSGLGSPTLITKQTNTSQTCPHASLKEAFLNWEQLFPNDSVLCQVEIKLNSTDRKKIDGKQASTLSVRKTRAYCTCSGVQVSRLGERKCLPETFYHLPLSLLYLNHVTAEL